MMSAVASASVPKITVVIGGCHGADSYAMVSYSINGRLFSFLDIKLLPYLKLEMNTNVQKS